MLPGRRDNDGVLFTVNGVSPGVENKQGGIAIDVTTGAVCITLVANSTDTYVNGFRVDDRGALVTDTGTIVCLQEGIARGVNGGVIGQLNAPPPSSKYIGGLRVDSQGRVHFKSGTPVTVGGFSSGFSAGF